MIKRLSASGIITTLCVPLCVAGNVTGLISIRFKQSRTFQREEIELTRALSHQAMLAIQLMRLSQQSRQAAVMAERNRMARDIHDTLAQGFTGVIMQLEAAKGATTQGDLAEAANHIERANKLARLSPRRGPTFRPSAAPSFHPQWKIIHRFGQFAQTPDRGH
jgi:signal transduction histidine kinase